MFVDRATVNKAWKAYRQHHNSLHEFNFGMLSFCVFAEAKMDDFQEWARGDQSDPRDYYLKVTERGAARIKVLASAAPENMWVLLKAVEAKYG